MELTTKVTKVNAKINIKTIEIIYDHIDKMELVELDQVLSHCNKARNIIIKNELETKIIDSLKVTYKNWPQLVNFAEGLKICKYENENCTEYCKFEVEFCSLPDDSSDEKKYLKLFGEGRYEDEINTKYCIISEKKENNNLLVIRRLGYYMENTYFVCDDAVDDITKNIGFNKEAISLKEKILLGTITKTTNLLSHFLKDIIDNMSSHL